VSARSTPGPVVRYEVVVVGGGPAGQQAALQSAKAGRSVLLVDREAGVGGECVHRGTIPSKTLRESAVFLQRLQRRETVADAARLGPSSKLADLMTRRDRVRQAYERCIAEQLGRSGVDVWCGVASFTSDRGLEVRSADGTLRRVRAETVFLATGSRPRTPANVPVDHEHVLDSDSILSLIYLPASLLVLGSGVIACEFASIFSSLGVQVTVIDRWPRPLGFLDPELTDRFVRAFERDGGTFLGGRVVERVAWDGLSAVEVALEGGEVVRAEKALCALGRTACTRGLALERAGLEVGPRGHVEVDAHCRTAVPHVYAVGDLIGPPALATSSMEQGRRAALHALSVPVPASFEVVPTGIYTVPEMSCIGLTDARAIEEHGGALVGRARFEELARGQIDGGQEGLLKLVSDPEGRRVLGVHILGEGATELIHVAQVAMLGELEVDGFVENIFNFPTLAEAYRVAALDVAAQRPQGLRRAG